jgi:hypothetical protein
VEENASSLLCRVPFAYRGNVASPQAAIWALAWASENFCGRKRATIHLPSILLLLRQLRVAVGNGLSTDVGTTIKNVSAC